MRLVVALAPVVAALSYPWSLQAFHTAYASPTAPMLAWVCLLAAFAVPGLGVWVARSVSRHRPQTVWYVRVKRVAFLSVAAPPLFVLMGVLLGRAGLSPLENVLWGALWLSAGVYVVLGATEREFHYERALPWVRVAHGLFSVLILVFLAFHLANHLLAWLGPDTHRVVMAWGRSVYRSAWGEPVLLGVLGLQVLTGGALVWRWSTAASDGFRAFQVASGDYLAVFLITHLNSAFGARYLRGIDTDWAWASGAPEGLLLDAWNIRLLPHYAFAVFFALGHAASGLRQVLLAHGVAPHRANALWMTGLTLSALVSAAISLALCTVGSQ